MDRRLTLADRLLADAQNALGTVFGAPSADRANPAGDRADVVLDDEERRHAAGLMRINHVGEICAQALYVGQAAVARDPATRAGLLAAAQEETDHLAWCAQRLEDLDSRPSLLNPLWYGGSYAIGVLAGLRGGQQAGAGGGVAGDRGLADIQGLRADFPDVVDAHQAGGVPAFLVVEHHVGAVAGGVRAFSRRGAEDGAEGVLGVRQQAVDEGQAAVHGRKCSGPSLGSSWWATSSVV